MLRSIAKKFGALRQYSNKNVTIATWNIEAVTGYKPITTFFEDFSIADKFGDLKDASGKTKRVYVLMSAYKDGDSIVPVQMEVKESTDSSQTPKLYVTVTLGKTKEGVNAMEASPTGNGSTTLPSFNIKLSDIVRNVNPSDGEFLMYIPDSMLNEAQRRAKWKAVDKRYFAALDAGKDYEVEQRAKLAARNAGYTISAYHGTGRADRVGTVFRPDRATSGPMAFFTDNRAIAENYSRDKQDTSIAYEGGVR